MVDQDGCGYEHAECPAKHCQSRIRQARTAELAHLAVSSVAPIVVAIVVVGLIVYCVVFAKQRRVESRI
jgi:heme/copper-type cytochrome/quinol oxidase subunit 2